MSIANDLGSLPIEYLLSAPLLAASEAQAKMAMVTAKFIEDVGMSNGVVRNVKFGYDTTDGSNVIHNELSVPILSIVNIPNLSVSEANVDFCMEVKTQSMDKSSVGTNTTVSASYGGWFTPVKANITGSVTTSHEHTRSTDKTAKYTISVKSKSNDMPEGLSRVLNILAANIRDPAHS